MRSTIDTCLRSVAGIYHYYVEGVGAEVDAGWPRSYYRSTFAEAI